MRPAGHSLPRAITTVFVKNDVIVTNCLVAIQCQLTDFIQHKQLIVCLFQQLN